MGRVPVPSLRAHRECDPLYIEQQPLFNAWNSYGNNSGLPGAIDGPLRYSGVCNITVTSSRVSAFYCPSDPNNGVTSRINVPKNGVSTPITFQNYVVNFGNTDMEQMTFNGIPFMGAPSPTSARRWSTSPVPTISNARPTAPR